MDMDAEAMPAAQGCWSSLPADLVNRVADCLLFTNDLDYYMDLRAVCQHWRSSTADPRSESNQLDPRFRPTRWVMLEETGDLFSLTQDDGPWLFLNSTTGRFVRRKLPLHHLDRDYHVVTSTGGGFLVLADREPPHAARVLNPFTGSMIRFKAPVPKQVCMMADVVVVPGGNGDLVPKLVLVSSVTSSLAADHNDDRRMFRIYVADPGSEEFLLVETSLAEVAASDSEEMLLLDPNPAVRSRVPLLCGLAVELAPGGEMVRVERNPQQQQRVRLFRMEKDTAGRAMMPVTSIGSRALFVGEYRCVSIDADRIPSLHPNCIYFQDAGTTSYVYDLSSDKEECIEETFGHLGDSEEETIDTCFCPIPLDQLLIQYVMCPKYFKPGLNLMMQGWGPPIPLEDVRADVSGTAAGGWLVVT